MPLGLVLWNRRTGKVQPVFMEGEVRETIPSRQRRRCVSVARVRFAQILGLVAAFAVPLFAGNSSKPDFGPNVLVFNPSMPAADIQRQIDEVYAIQRDSEFGSARYALLFLPGDYRSEEHTSEL